MSTYITHGGPFYQEPPYFRIKYWMVVSVTEPVSPIFCSPAYFTELIFAV